MPATNLPQLLDFEGQFENAAQQVLAAVGITAFISQEGVKLPLINTGISFDAGPALDAMTFLQKPSNWPAGRSAPQEYFRFTGTLEMRIEVPRDDNAATLPGVDNLFAQFRGLTRAAFLRTMAPFNSTNLPFYEVGDIKPMGAQTGYEGTRNIDFCLVRFLITWDILDGAWPAWP